MMHVSYPSGILAASGWGSAVRDRGFNMRGRVVSSRTWAVLVVGLCASIGAYASVLAAGGEVVAGNIANLALPLYAAVVTLYAALRFDRDEPMRTQWLLLGMGFVALTVGHATWSYFEVWLSRLAPFPSVPELMTVVTYAMLGAGVWSAMMSFRKFADPRIPLASAAAVCSAVTGVVWISTAMPLLRLQTLPPFAMGLAVIYPLVDIWLMLYPVIAFAIMLTRLGSALVARPWWLVVAGMLAIVVADSIFALDLWAGAYVAGGSDLGWWIGGTLIAAAASLALDIHKPAIAPQVQPVAATEGSAL